MKLNFSFTPGFSLGPEPSFKLGNRFNGFQPGSSRTIRVSRKPLKRLGVFEQAATPSLKLGENKKLTLSLLNEAKGMLTAN